MIPEVFQVAVDECFFGVEAKCDDVAGVVHGILHGIFTGETIIKNSLLIIRQHEDQGHVEALLEPLGKLHGDGVAQV